MALARPSAYHAASTTNINIPNIHIFSFYSFWIYLDGLSQCFMYPEPSEAKAYSHILRIKRFWIHCIWYNHRERKKLRRKRLNDLFLDLFFCWSLLLLLLCKIGIKWMCSFCKNGERQPWGHETDRNKIERKSREKKCRKEIINRWRQLKHKKQHNMTWL